MPLDALDLDEVGEAAVKASRAAHYAYENAGGFPCISRDPQVRDRDIGEAFIRELERRGFEVSRG